MHFYLQSKLDSRVRIFFDARRRNVTRALMFVLAAAVQVDRIARCTQLLQCHCVPAGLGASPSRDLSRKMILALAELSRPAIES
jgi:hypothetical protein